MTRTDSVQTAILAAMAAMMLGACVTTTTTAQQPQLLSDTGAGGAISSGANMRPKRLAIAHCAQYKNHAVLGDVQRVGGAVAGSRQIDGSATSSFTTCTGETLDFQSFAMGLGSALVFADLFVSKQAERWLRND